MTVTSEQKKTLILIVVLGVLALGGCAWYWYMLGRTAVAVSTKQANDAIEKQKVVDAKLEEFAKFKKDVEDSGTWEELKLRLSLIESRLPKTEEAFGFFEALDEILRKTSVSNQRLEKQKTNPEVRYTEIPYSIRAVGRYHEFGQFLSLVENNEKRFMRVKTFQITDDAKRPSLHPIGVEIATYSFSSRD